MVRNSQKLKCKLELTTSAAIRVWPGQNLSVLPQIHPPDYNILGIRKGAEKISVSNGPPGLEKRYESPDAPSHFNLKNP